MKNKINKIGGKKVLYDEKTGLYYREDTSDLYCIKEVKSYGKFYDSLEGHKVLDIGANMGSFAHLAIENGAKKVYSFEPDNENCEIFKMQEHYKQGKSKLYEGAVKKESGEAILSYGRGSSRGCQSTYKEVRGRELMEVEAYSFESILKKIKPESAKIDIEGEEFNLDMNLLLEYEVNNIAIEIHTKQNRKKAAEYFEWFSKNYKQLNGSKITGFSATTFIGVR